MKKNIVEDFDYIYILGIGGACMSSIANFFLWKEKNVFGYDQTKSENTFDLEKKLVEINYIDEIDFIPKKILESKENSCVIYTSCLGNNNPENSKIFSFLKSENFILKKRSDFFYDLSKDKFTIALAGTHGKTSTISLLTHILISNEKKIVSFVGAKVINYQKNFITNAKKDEDYIVLIEADEYDNFFLSLNYDLATITTCDPDHLDFFLSKENFEKSFLEFISKNENKVFLNQKVYEVLNLKKNEKKNIFKYGFSDSCDVFIKNYLIENFVYNCEIEVKSKKLSFRFKSNMIGEHQIENLAAILSICIEFELNEDQIQSSLNSYLGVYRRTQIIKKNSEHIWIDDFAHHPKELEALISSVYNFFGQKRIFLIFQPHTYTRTRDFLDLFSEILSKVDFLFLLEIYAARENDIYNISSKDIFEKVTTKKFYQQDLIQTILENKENFDILLTVGAGNIFFILKDDLEKIII